MQSCNLFLESTCFPVSPVEGLSLTGGFSAGELCHSGYFGGRWVNNCHCWQPAISWFHWLHSCYLLPLL